MQLAKVLTVREVAIVLHVHSSTIYRLLKEHKIPAFRIGSDWRFNEEAIGDWIRNDAQMPIIDIVEKES
jgi:excisionase family DNA binding protein